MIKTDRFKIFLQTKCRNERTYCEHVLLKIFKELNYPDDLKIRLFDARSRTWKIKPTIDYLFLVDDIPALAVEAEYPAKKFDAGFEQVKFFATNFNPIDRGIRKQNVPYIMVASGERVEMFKLVVDEAALSFKFEPLRGLLTWKELVERINKSFKVTQDALEEGEALALDQFTSILKEVCDAIESNGRPKFTKDESVLVMNEILTLSLLTSMKRETGYNSYRLSKRVRDKIEDTLGRYDLRKLEGKNLAYAYRQLVAKNFTGKGFGWVDKEEVGRYLTPAEVIDFMVNLIDIEPKDRVIDFACGSGGFLGAIASRMVNKVDINQYLKEKLFACDLDQFSVSTARIFMKLLLPGEQPPAELRKDSFYAKSLKPRVQISIFDVQRRKGVLNIYHHNGLFSEKKHTWEKDDLRDIIQDENFDVVISNPPGGAISGLRSKVENYLRKVLPLGNGKKLLNPVLFIQRAIQLARDNGKICLIVPDGTLANAALKYLRDYFFERCAVKAIVSLPRGIFPNVPSKMSILYMIKKKKPKKRQTIFTAGIETDKSYNIEMEFNEIYEKYKKI